MRPTRVAHSLRKRQLWSDASRRTERPVQTRTVAHRGRSRIPLLSAQKPHACSTDCACGGECVTRNSRGRRFACRGEPVNIQQEDGSARVMPVSGGGAYTTTSDLATVLRALDEIRSEVSHDLPSPLDGAMRNAVVIRPTSGRSEGRRLGRFGRTYWLDRPGPLMPRPAPREMCLRSRLPCRLRRLRHADLPVVYHALAELEPCLKRQ